MNLSDEIFIPLPRDQVYAALNDADILRDCIPGCEELIKHSDTELETKLVLKIGPVKAKFSFDILLSPDAPPERFTLSGEGNGGAAGFAKGSATVELQEVDGGTNLVYEASADIGGKLAQLGGRLIQGTAKLLSGKFFKAFAARVVPENVE